MAADCIQLELRIKFYVLTTDFIRENQLYQNNSAPFIFLLFLYTRWSKKNFQFFAFSERDREMGQLKMETHREEQKAVISFKFGYYFLIFSFRRFSQFCNLSFQILGSLQFFNLYYVFSFLQSLITQRFRCYFYYIIFCSFIPFSLRYLVVERRRNSQFKYTSILWLKGQGQQCHCRVAAVITTIYGTTTICTISTKPKALKRWITPKDKPFGRRWKTNGIFFPTIIMAINPNNMTPTYSCFIVVLSLTFCYRSQDPDAHLSPNLPSSKLLNQVHTSSSPKVPSSPDP